MLLAVKPRIFLGSTDTDRDLHERTSGIYLRADPADGRTLDGDDPLARTEVLEHRLREWRAIVNA